MSTVRFSRASAKKMRRGCRGGARCSSKHRCRVACSFHGGLRGGFYGRFRGGFPGEIRRFVPALFDLHFKGFFDALSTDSRSAAVVGALIAMAHALKLRVTAEGIEA